jgi:CTP-dependent riboflavin kinase
MRSARAVRCLQEGVAATVKVFFISHHEYGGQSIFSAVLKGRSGYGIRPERTTMPRH